MFNPFGSKKTEQKDAAGANNAVNVKKLQAHETECHHCKTLNLKTGLFCTKCDRRLDRPDGDHGSE